MVSLSLGLHVTEFSKSILSEAGLMYWLYVTALVKRFHTKIRDRSINIPGFVVSMLFSTIRHINQQPITWS